MIHPTAVISPQAIIADSAEIDAFVCIDADVIIGEDVKVFAGAYIGKPPRAAGIVRNQPKAKPQTMIGDGSVIGSHAVIYAGNEIGAGVLIGDGVTLRENGVVGRESIIGNNSTLQNDVQIGKRVRIVDLSHITARVVIEDEVFWSVGVVSMNDNGFGVGDDLRPPYVGYGAAIGGGAILLPGVRVGQGSVVAAGAVVTKDVADETTVMGVPARVKAPAPETDREIWESVYFSGSMYPEALPDRPYADGAIEAES